MDFRPLNMRLDEVVTVSGAAPAWVSSPAPGVARRPLEREAAESGRTTSIVRYAPGSRFPGHVHGGGEEFLVLEGVFSDEHGDYPAGTYVRNPPGSSHAPFSDGGCVIFVKLCQFPAGDRRRVVCTWRDESSWALGEAGMRETVLHRHGAERVALQRWGAGTELACRGRGGVEILVLEGAVEAPGGVFGAWSWLRFPAASAAVLRPSGTCRVYVKTGHLSGV